MSSVDVVVTHQSINLFCNVLLFHQTGLCFCISFRCIKVYIITHFLVYFLGYGAWLLQMVIYGFSYLKQLMLVLIATIFQSFLMPFNANLMQGNS